MDVQDRRLVVSKIVAAKVWVCEFCDKPLYAWDDMKNHLRQEHKIDCDSPLALCGQLGDNYIVSDMAVPENLL